MEYTDAVNSQSLQILQIQYDSYISQWNMLYYSRLQYSQIHHKGRKKKLKYQIIATPLGTEEYSIEDQGTFTAEIEPNEGVFSITSPLVKTRRTFIKEIAYLSTEGFIRCYERVSEQEEEEEKESKEHGEGGRNVFDV